MKTSKALTSLSLLGLAAAQTSVVSVFLGADIESRPLVGSIVGHDATATTYSVTCPPSPDDCGLGPGLVVTNGPKTAAWTMDDGGRDFTGIMECALTGTTAAMCTETFGGTDANFPGTSVYALTSSRLEYIPATITAGLFKGFSDATTTTTATATTTATSQVSGSTTASEGPVDPTSLSAAGLPRPGSSGWGVGGVAVALAAAVL